MKKEDRTNRIIARGEISDHAHVIIGDAAVTQENNEVHIEVHGEATIRHLLESRWVEEGVEVWTEEHNDMVIAPGKYKYIQQKEFDPYEDAIRAVQD